MYRGKKVPRKDSKSHFKTNTVWKIGTVKVDWERKSNERDRTSKTRDEKFRGEVPWRGIQKGKRPERKTKGGVKERGNSNTEGSKSKEREKEFIGYFSIKIIKKSFSLCFYFT